MSSTCGQRRRFEVGFVPDRRVGRREAEHGRVEILEALVGDPRRDFGAETAGECVLVEHEHPTGPFDRLGDESAGPTARSCAGR